MTDNDQLMKKFTVNQLLAYANTNFSSLSVNKTNLMAVKDIFDRLNNNIQPSC